MKIGIISSGNESLALFLFLSKYDHEYVVFYDQYFWPYSDKPFDDIKHRIYKACEVLATHHVDAVILPPIYELWFLDTKESLPVRILPLFSTYVLEYCFRYSLVGKL